MNIKEKDMSPLTFAQKRENRLTNAYLSLEDLGSMKVAELRALATQCGIKRGKLKKAELVALIHSDLEPERIEIASKEVKASQVELAEKANKLSETEIGDVALKYFKSIKNITHKLWDRNTGKLGLGSGEVFDLKEEFLSEFTSLYLSTNYRCNMLKEFKKQVYAFLKEEHDEWREHYSQILSNFLAGVGAVSKRWTHEKNKVYAEKIVSRKTEKKAIDVTGLLAKTKEILAEPNEYSWQDVALALIFATGRRPGEIMSTATFTGFDDHSVTFWGRLKTKESQGGEEHLKELTIPSLVPGNQVIEGMKVISDKRIYPLDSSFKKHQEAAAIYGKSSQSKALQRHIKKFIANVGLDVKMTPKSLRAVYAQYLFALNNANEQIMDKDLYIAKIMGHSEGDITTKKAYDADFRVVL